ncbi:M16 family metallopeptidase [Pseudoroseomonas globiformis]|uniref:M16 family metallopeptidase n=1 Tax=Teichococcus globiformis TaxID=2307229 RepID=A0ABV7G641_9PROT
MSGSAGFSLPIQVVEAAGLTAWLAEDHSVPVVSLSWSWPGGAALDPAGQEGAARLAAALMTEGAGDLDANAFADALRDEAIGLDFGAGRDEFEGGFRALAPALPQAVRLARLAMTEPRFAEADIARLRARAIASARQMLEGPRGRGSRAFWAAAYPDHPAGRPSGGTEESLAGLTEAQLRAPLTRHLRRNGGLRIAASGAITAAQLTQLLPQLFGALPEAPAEALPPLPDFRDFGTQVVPVAAPQSSVIFGQPGIAPRDPDWEAAQVMLRILAGGGFTARLTRSIREQRGLTYGIGAGLDSFYGQAVLVGSCATANARVSELLSVLREEWARMAANGPTSEEMDEAIAYLTGSQPLQFTDSRRIAATLLAMQRNDRPLDWLTRRPERLAAITRDHAASLAKRLLQPEGLSITVAGQPEGI